MRDDTIKLTPHAREALISARERARTLGQCQIVPEHILWGIVAEETSPAAALLKDLNVELSQLRRRVEQTLKREPHLARGKPDLTEGTQSALKGAVREARALGCDYVGSEHLLLGLLREGPSPAADLLGQWNVNVHNVRAQLETYALPKEGAAQPLRSGTSQVATTGRTAFLPSPIFVALVFVTVIAGYLTYKRALYPNVTLFLFVTSGWVVSLSLHEFGHALTAWWGGDRQVVDRGYLTLNPLKYTHPLFSIALPLTFLAMGGIGLPGGAVYIREHSIRKRSMRSLTAAAGPIMTALFGLILSLPFIFGLDDRYEMHMEFWAGLGLLVNLQITASLFSLLPFPGLDGFGVVAPYLSRRLSTGIRKLGSWSWVILFALFFADTPVARGFWFVVWQIEALLGIDPSWVYRGLDLFRFWMLG